MLILSLRYGSVVVLQRAEHIWDAVLGALELQVERAAFETWLRGTCGVSYADGVFVVGTGSAFVSEMLERRMCSLIEGTVERVLGEPAEVRFEVMGTGDGDDGVGADGGGDDGGDGVPALAGVNGDDAGAGAADEGAGVSGGGAGAGVRMGEADYRGAALNSKYTFGRFIVGKSNELAHAAAQAVADKPGVVYNPLVLYSAVGLGKTHLLHAIGHEVMGRGMSVIYATTEEFTNEYIRAIREGRTEDFRLRYRNADLLLLDDIQFLIGKEQTQEGFFHTFNALHMSNRQIVITSDRPVPALKVLEERISSRLNWGLVADIQSPDLETRLAILRAKAEQMRVRVATDVMELLGSRIFRNIRELEGSLNKVVAYAQLTGRVLDTELVRQVVWDTLDAGERREPSEEEVLDAVSAHFGVDREILRGAKRDKRTAQARQVAMYILREDVGMGATAIARSLGRKDHSTVLHGCRTIENQQNVDDKLRRDIMRIRERLAGG